MRLSTTLSVYFGRQFFTWVGLVFLVFIATIFVFDLVELLRRGASKETADVGTLMLMAFMKLPFMAQKAIPFAILIGGILCFSKLTRSHELVVARAAGVSAWQFMLPALIIAFLVGTVTITIYNPLASAMVSRYEQLEATHLRKQASLLAISSSGLWLRQAGQSGESVIHAQRVTEPDTVLHDVIIFRFEGTDSFIGRIDAASAKLEDGYWDLQDAVLTAPDRPAEFTDRYKLSTDLTLSQIQDSFASPETLSFWELPGFIKVLEKAGFSAVKHRIHWYALLSAPLLFCAMVLIAATFSLRLTRRGGTGLLIAAGVLTGFVFYFLSDVVLALGLSGKIPPALAAWTPAGICTLLGIGLLFHLEDG